ncbi:MAG: hypothetical protein AABZ47_12000 [Planctomycetota bacterium]
MKSGIFKVLFLAVCGIIVVLGGCRSDKLVHANFTQIRPHVSTETEVAALIGDPDAKLTEEWIYTRPDQHLTAKVHFDLHGRVTRVEWIDALGETWEDSDDSQAGRK